MAPAPSISAKSAFAGDERIVRRGPNVSLFSRAKKCSIADPDRKRQLVDIVTA
jgi:hypothetical protein